MQRKPIDPHIPLEYCNTCYDKHADRNIPTFVLLPGLRDGFDFYYGMFMRCNCGYKSEIKRYRSDTARKYVFDDLVKAWNSDNG